MNTTHDLELYGLRLSVTGTYIRGAWGTYEDPPEPTTFEIDSVYCNGVNLTELFDSTYVSISSAGMCHKCKKTNRVTRITVLEDLEHEILEKYYE